MLAWAQYFALWAKFPETRLHVSFRTRPFDELSHRHKDHLPFRLQRREAITTCMPYACFLTNFKAMDSLQLERPILCRRASKVADST